MGCLQLLCFFLLTASVLGQSTPSSNVNEAPQWRDDLSVRLGLGLFENIPIGTTIGQLLAVDPEGLLVEYSVIETETFTVFLNGTVILNRELDRETSVINPNNNGIQLSVTFVAQDPLDASNKRNTIEAHHIVTVLDVNDNNPAFQNAPYNAIVKEGPDQVGTRVFSGISVTDADSSLNAVVKISCVPTDILTTFPCNIFSISQDLIGEGDYVGHVNLQQTLDYETRNTYVFNIIAKDSGTPSLNVTIGIIINVEDLPDSPPVFLNGRQSIVMQENIPSGMSVGFLQARDGDRGISNPVKIVITEDIYNHFSIDDAVDQGDGSYRASILVNTPIDRENKNTLGRYEFSVQAIEMVNGIEDPNAVVDSIVIVDILDVNDNPPMFDRSDYTVTVAEFSGTDQRKGQISDLNMLVTDKDAASYGSFTLEVETQSPPTFSTFPKTATGSTPANLYVEEPMYMDYEKPEYRTQIVTVIAREIVEARPNAGFRTSTATVTVILTDINDNIPIFGKQEYSAPIQENHAVGTSVTQITADDADSGRNGLITYSLQGTGSEFFTVDSSTGLVTLALEVDYETKKLFQIYFVASDQGQNPRSNSVLLNIPVTDYNDVGPVFDPLFYQTIITESSTNLQPPVTVSATDVEQVSVTYTIVSGNLENDPFSMDRFTGVLSLNRLINYKETKGTGFVALTVIASDNTSPVQTSSTIITITVRDENNHFPVFDPSDITRSISENADITSEVVTITATDADAGSNGNVRYYIAGGSSDHFSIGSTSGRITVSDKLDRDLIPVYILIVIGQDQGSPPQSGTATVTVSLTDANNKDPIFLQDVYLVSISDTLPVGSLAETVKAEDADSSNDLFYSIISNTITARDSNSLPLVSAFPFDFKNAFGIHNKTGKITTRLALNHENAADVSFEVQVQDVGGLPFFQVASASVIIRIYGSTESRPYFAAPWTYENPRYSLSISEDLPQGTSIFTFVARDAATGNAITNFEEIGGANNYLKVGRESGDLQLESAIDFEVLTIKQISISVRGISADGLRTADATMTVSINDVNDNPPEFTQIVYSFLVPESLRYPGRIGSVFAFDKDIGQFATIEYVLQGQGIDMFQILPEGVIIVRDDTTLDYETTPFYSLLVIAIDNPPRDNGSPNTGSVRLRATSQLQITLTDVNDNDPVFVVSDPSYDFDTVETIGINTPIGVVSATDKDSGQNGQIRYSLVKNDNERVDITTQFSIDVREGFLRNYLSLRDQSPNSPFKGYVVATDQGYPFRSTSIAVTINVGSGLLNDGKPLFTVPKIGEVKPIPEDYPDGGFIIKAEARPRTDVTSQIEYAFLKVGDLNQDFSKFRIDSVTGDITKQGELDYEDKRTYNLIITAVDLSNRTLNSSRLLTVLVTDVDDNEPMFDNTAGTCYLNLDSVTVPEDKPIDSRITRVQACDADSSLHNAMQYLLFKDDDRCSDNNLDDFGLNLINGEVYVNKKLDREMKDLYHLCIYVEPASPTSTVVRQTGLTFAQLQDLNQALNLTVFISDVNDNGPKFDSTKNSTVMFNIVPNRPVVFQANATDDDISPFDYVVYAITNITFASQEQSNLYLGLFSIGYDTGFITPTVADYTTFVGGYFDITVMATDFRRPSMNTTVKIKIHVVELGQRIRLVLNKPATESQEDAQNLIKLLTELEVFIDLKDLRPCGPRPRSGRGVTARKQVFQIDEYRLTSDLDEEFPDTKFTISMISYHNDRNGVTDAKRTDVCFIAIANDTVLNLKEVIDHLDRAGAILSTYQASDPGVCQPETTDTFNGYDIFWWIVVALAIFIFVCCVIAIIAAYILARNYERFQYSKTVALVRQ